MAATRVQNSCTTKENPIREVISISMKKTLQKQALRIQLYNTQSRVGSKKTSLACCIFCFILFYFNF